MRKIYVDKSDSVASVIEKILGTEDDSIVLYVPRFTKLGSSTNNFRLLKREIDSSGKNVEIESVDDEVLDLSKSVGIKAANPFFRKNRRAVSDILGPETPNGAHSRKDKMHIDEDANDDLEEGEDESSEEEGDSSEESEDYYEETPKQRIAYHHRAISLRRHLKKFNIFVALGTILVIGIIFFIALSVLPRASVKVTLEENIRDFSGSLIASVSIKDAYISNGQVKIAGEVFERTKNVTNSYPATGSETVSRKATGKITIYNAYSSDAQPLVKDTRFESPDGKIFRITKGVTVPGAKIVNNKIAPSSIEVAVVADKPGVEYNVDAARFRIPGLKGSPKYDGFYGESTSPMSGGFVGIAKVPTASDIIKAKDKNQKILQIALDSEDSLVNSSEINIKIIDDASKFVVLKEEVDKTTDAAGQFKLTTYAVKKLFGFREGDLINVLKEQVVSEIKMQEANKTESSSSDEIDLVLKNHSIIYGPPSVDFDKKQMSTSLKFKSTWVRVFDIPEFRNLILGRMEEDFSGDIKKISGIESINVILWPFWVNRVPSKIEKVSIDVE